MGKYWREEIARPNGIDVWIGELGPTQLERIATIYPPKRLNVSADEANFYRSMGDKDSLAFRAFASPGGMRGLSDVNKLEVQQAGLPALGGVASARGLAKFYAILAAGGEWDGVQVIPKSIVRLGSQPISQGQDKTLLMPTAFSSGWMLDPAGENGEKQRQLFGPSKKAFGQPGAGGSHAFADPESGISFAYVMNQMEAGVLPNEKSLGLVRDLYGL
ncbi:MAG: serine hydrolase domain-containing protein [Verrucomicrobiota bacterium]